MIDFIKAHYGKLIAFLGIWIAEAQFQLSAYIKALLVAVGIGE